MSTNLNGLLCLICLRPATLRPAALRQAVLAASAAALFITGCGALSNPGTSLTAAATNTLAGRVHGGRQPVAFATITLYAPGTTGYGSAPTSIVSTISDADGNFTLPRPYTCPANSGNVYLLATGGDPGAGANTALALAAELGPCSALSSSTFVDITEATTIAAAYTLAPFAAVTTGNTGIGTSATNLVGLNNAFVPAGNLVNTATGTARAAAEISGLVLPQAEINTLANILSACVNSTGATGSTDPCGQLFNAATPPGGSVPTDTFQAALDIALNPGNNVTALYGLATAVVPFQPTLSAAPTDFAVAICYTGGSIAASGGIAGIDIDAQGNAWFATVSNSSVYANLAEVTPSGTFIPGSGGFLANTTFSTPQAIAIDGSGLVYAVDYGQSRIARVDSAGANPAYLSPSYMFGPSGLAIDNTDGSLWVTNYYQGTKVTHMSASTGADLTGSPFSGQDVPYGIALDASGSPWVVNADAYTPGTGNGFLTKFTPASGSYTTQNFTTGTASFPVDVAIDNSANVWVAGYSGLSKFDATGSLLSPSGGYPLSAATKPFSVAIDGLGRAFTSNAAVNSTNNFVNIPGTIAVFSSTGTLLSTNVAATTSAGNFLGYSANKTIPAQPFGPLGLKIDASGNLWAAGSNSTTPQTLTQIIGIAAPVTTPLSVATSTAKLGTRP